jgi:hypothetical protein
MATLQKLIAALCLGTAVLVALPADAQWRGGWWGPGFGYPYYGYHYGYYPYGYYPTYPTYPVPVVPYAAYPAAGDHCSTPQKSCLLYNPAPVGTGCSCRAPGGGYFRGAVVP